MDWHLAALASNAVVSTAHAAGWPRKPSAARPTWLGLVLGLRF